MPDFKLDEKEITVFYAGISSPNLKEQFLRYQKIALAVKSRLDTLTAGEWDGDADILGEIIDELNKIWELKNA